MRISAIPTAPVVPGGPTLLQLLDQYLPHITPGQMVAVSSKIVSICEGRVIPDQDIDREELILREADYYRDPSSNPYHFAITIKNDNLIGSAGVDQSNGNGHFVLWPADAQATANLIRQHLVARAGGPVGVIITDSHSLPMRRGATGFGLAHSGFRAIVRYAGRPDIFGRPFKSESANLLDGLSAAAVTVMGEGSEQTPIALIEDIDFVDFHNRNPNPEELDELRVPLEDDVYREAFEAINWNKRPK